MKRMHLMEPRLKSQNKAMYESVVDNLSKEFISPKNKHISSCIVSVIRNNMD